MKSLRAYLQPGEEVKYRARIHFVLFVQPSILLAIGYVCYLDEARIIHYLGVTLLFLGLVSLIQRLFIKLGSVYFVTNLRVIFKSGIIARQVHSLILFKVEGLLVTQSFMGRVLNYGTVVITTGGATNTYPFVTNPIQFKNAVNIQVEEYFSE
jgi:uncharacterized membrane protein YdbT with pleckstrin-like domain